MKVVIAGFLATGVMLAMVASACSDDETTTTTTSASTTRATSTSTSSATTGSSAGGSGGSASVGGMGGAGGGGDCPTCNDVATMQAEPGALCPGTESEMLFNAVIMCMCSMCTDECMATCTMGMPPSTDCNTCLGASCGAEAAACFADM